LTFYNKQAQFTAAELLTKRKNVSDLIRKKLTERARAFGVLVDDISIVSRSSRSSSSTLSVARVSANN